MAGLVFGLLLLGVLLPIAEVSDNYMLSDPYAPLAIITATALVVAFYPASDRWSPAREDSTAILGGWTGIRLGFWATYQAGFLRGPPVPPPYPILWPAFEQYGHMLLRLAIGGVIVIASRAVFKPITYLAVSALFGADGRALKRQRNCIENKLKIRVNIVSKLVTYAFIGINMITMAPVVFKVIGCERSTFFTEV